MALRLSLFAALLVAWPTSGRASDASLDQASTSNSTGLGAEQDALKAWMQNLEIPLFNMTVPLPMGMGDFSVQGGYCTGLTLDGLKTQDLSQDQVLEFGVQVLGLGISCFVKGYCQPPSPDFGDAGPIDINITFAGSSFNGSVRINPYVSFMAEDLPLPMGQINMTSCSGGMAATGFSHAGTGFLAEMLGFMSEAEVVETVGYAINDPICEGITSFLAANGTAIVGQAAEMVSMVLMPPFPDPEPKALKPTLAWEEYPPIGVAKALIAERFGLFAEKMLSIINVTDFNSTLYEQEEVRLALSMLHIEGGVGEDGLGLDIRARDSSLGVNADLAGMTFRSGFDVAVNLPEQPEAAQKFDQQIGLTIGLRQVAMGVRAMVDEDTLNNLELDDAMHSPRCVAQCLEGTTDPAEEALAIEDLHVELRPLFELSAPGALATDGTHFINTLLGALFRGYLPTVNALVNGGLGITKGLIDDLIWKNIKALPPCSREDLFFVLSEEGVMALWSTFVFLAGMGLPVSLLAHFFWKRPAHEQPEAREVTVDAPAARPGGVREFPRPAKVYSRVALANEPCVPRFMAVYFPFAVLAVMVLFLYADLDIGTTVTMVMDAEGRQARIGPLFSFSLVNTVSHCWSSKAYFIAVLTVIASGVWPFTKLVMLLVAWMVPPRCFSVWRRGKILAFLDAWGKYSFLDSWFLVLTLSAFSLEWMSLGTADLKIQTTPAPAFYAFFAATVLSLVLGHVASEYHRAADKQAAAAAAAKAKDTEATESAEAGLLKMPLCGFASVTEHYVLLGLLVASAIVAVVGTFLTSFSFSMSGIAPEFLFGGMIEKKYSLFSVGMSVASGRYNETGLIGLEVVFVALAVLVPSVLLVLLSLLWLVPMSLKRQRRCLHACRFLDAWASFDVAALVLAIACGEFARLADWLVYEGNFAGPCKMVRDLTKDECMKIEFHAFPALAALFMAGAALLVIPKVSMRRFDRAIMRRAASADGKAEKVEKVVSAPEPTQV